MDEEIPKVMLVLRDVLGWKTYASQLSSVAEEVLPSARIHRIRPGVLERVFLKRHNRTILDWYRFSNPVSAFRGPLGRDLRDLIDRDRPDVIHFAAHWPAAAHAFRDGAAPFTVALDATLSNMQRFKGKRLWSREEMDLEKDLLQRADLIFPWSTWVRDALLSDYGIAAEKIRIVPPSISMRGTERPSNVGNCDLPKILFVGNDFLRKGGDMLHRWVTGPLAGRCELHIVSHDKRARLGGSHVVFHGAVGHRELINSLMPEMDLICHPTQSDMSALVLVEAARAGLPCVASAVGGIPDLVIEGRTGFLVDRRDEAGFVERLEQMIGDHEMRGRMGRAAYEWARDHLDADVNYRNMLFDIVKTGAAARV